MKKVLEVKPRWIVVLATAGSCAGTFATVSVLAVAASAQAAPTLTPTQPCYRAYDGVQPGGVTAQAAGFTPGTYVTEAFNAKGPSSAPPSAWDHPANPNDSQPSPVAPDGSFKVINAAYGVANPLGAQTQKVGTISVGLVEYQIDYNSGSYQPDGVFASVDVKLVNFGMTFRLAGKGKYTPRRSVQFTASGYIGSPTLYEHYVYEDPRSAAQVVKKTVALGTPQPPCGILVTKVRRWPIRHPAKGRWLLVFNTKATPGPTPDDVIYRVDVR